MSSDNHATNGTSTNSAVSTSGVSTNGVSPPAELLARAAEILGVDDRDQLPGHPVPGARVMVTVAGSDRRQVMALPVDVPVGRLAADLGVAVGVTVISRVSTRGGEPILPDQTLAEVGVRAGSVIYVDAVGVPSPNVPAVRPTGFGLYQAHGAVARRPGPAAGPTPRRWAILAGSVLALSVVSMLLGAALFGGASGSSSAASTPTADDLLAARAAGAWVTGAPFTGGRMAGVPADLGRSGPALAGTVEAVASSTSATITSHLFIVGTPSSSPYGLSVVTYKGRVAYPVTVTTLPFASPASTGTAPPVPQTGKIVAPTATAQIQAQAWAAKMFGPPNQPVDGLGYSLAGHVTVLTQWIPAAASAAMVARVSVPLAGIPPATPGARAVAAAHAALTVDAATVAADQQALAAKNDAVRSAQDPVIQADTAAQAAVAAANAANPPNPPPLAAAVTAAQQAATVAADALTAAQQAQAAAAAALGSARQTQATDTAALAAASRTAAETVTSVYDVALDAHGQPVAWAPADYRIGNRR